MTENPAIEAMARGIWGGDHLLDSDECRQVAQAALTAYHEYLAATGFAVVPVEPTEAMADAGVKAFVEGGGVYRAMIAAAKGKG